MRSLRPGSLGAASLCLALAACGARSSLQQANDADSGGAGGAAAGSGGVGGAGGAGPGGTAGSAGTAGSGGTGVASCSKLIVDGPPLSPVTLSNNAYQYTPWLARIEPDASRVGFVYVEHQKPYNEFLRVASVALDSPWGAWPASLGTSAYHGMCDGFVVGPGAGGTFSMLTTDEPKNSSNEPEGMVVWAPTAGVSGATGQFFNDIPPGFPLLVTSNGPRYLAGFQRLLGKDLYHLSFARVSIGAGEPFSFGAPVACGLDATLAGSAIPLDDSFLVVLSNGRPFGKCLTDDLADAPPSRVQLVKMENDVSKTTLMFEDQQESTYIFQARLTPGQDGAWAAWERIPIGPPAERRLQLLHIDASGSPESGKIIDVSFGTVALPIAIAALGPSVALATLGEDGGGLGVYILAADGSLLGQTTLEAGGGFELDGSVSLLGSPEGDRLLVAWGESSAVNNDARRVRVARLACAGP